MAVPLTITKAQARCIWLRSQRLDELAPFGSGPAATQAAVEHLGYVQIDTINVIERCHHHILYSRIPEYQRDHLRLAQSVDKTVFEYWTHALAYVPTRDFRFYVRDMRQQSRKPHPWFAGVKDTDVRRLVLRIRKHGALSIRDIDDDVLVEKEHEWASRKPSKRALQFAFFKGLLTISQRTGMLKSYELTARHFGWVKLPPAASERETLHHLLERSLRSQGIVSLDSMCHLSAWRKPGLKRIVEARVRRNELVSVVLEGAQKVEHWVRPETLDTSLARPSDGSTHEAAHGLVHILSPFDPLIIQRKRLHLFFDYLHRFEAYVPKHKRVFGYFACPVLAGDQVVAAIDLKTDRERRKLLVQKWTWLSKGAARAHKQTVEQALHRFEKFQLAH